MTFLSGLTDILDLFSGPESWQSRTQPEIIFTSPEGVEFTAFWARNPRTMEKKLGVFQYPKIIGTGVQDLGMRSATYPISIFFEGPDNDIQAEEFFEATKQTGKWTVIHPTKGSLDLQLVSVTEITDVVDSANITQFDCEWMESIDISVIASLPELGSIIGGQLGDLNDSSLAEFAENVDQSEASGLFAVIETTKKVVSAVINTTQKLTEGVATINNRIIAVQRGIQDAILQPALDLLALGGQIQTLIQLPVLATNDIKARLSGFGELFDELFELSPEGNSVASKNIAAVQQLALVAALGANAKIVSTLPAGVSPSTIVPPPSTDAQITNFGLALTRTDVVGIATDISGLLSDTTDNLDTTQENFDDTTIDKQYFSMSDSYPDAVLITAQAVAFALQFAFNLSIERRFILKRPASPIRITIEQYGTLGPNDSAMDFFMETNSLQGNEILMLPAGREVVTYV